MVAAPKPGVAVSATEVCAYAKGPRPSMLAAVGSGPRSYPAAWAVAVTSSDGVVRATDATSVARVARIFMAGLREVGRSSSSDAGSRALPGHGDSPVS